jgi:glucose-6-phosphate 1-dehydrogenase
MPATVLTMFGATGDLARKKLFPALGQLAQAGQLPDELLIQAIGRRPLNDTSFADYLPDIPALRQKVRYVRMDATDPSAYVGLLPVDARNIVYLSVEPHLVPQIIASLGGLGLPRDPTRMMLVLEKPFGFDAASARELDDLLCERFAEEQLFRIDHYIGKESVQNLLAFRFANRLFEAAWNRDQIEQIQITVAETADVADRGAFYDATGAMRDLVQNHVLQLLAYLTMEEPVSLTHEALADASQAVLDTLVAEPDRIIYGQYAGYSEAEKIAAGSQTETFVALRCVLDSERWQGVPIYIRTGKALDRRVSEIAVLFKSAGPPFTGDESDASGIVFRLQPAEGIAIQLFAKSPEMSDHVEPISLEYYAAEAFGDVPDAYVRLFHDFFAGDRTLSLRSDVIEACWKFIDALLRTKPEQPVHSYTYGSWGPDAARELIARDGRHWIVRAPESTAKQQLIEE